MKKTASPAPNLSTQAEKQILGNAPSASAEASLMGDTSVPNGELSPVESAILCMDKQLQMGMAMIKEIKNQTAMLETAFKLMSYELSVIAKNLNGME